MAAIERATHEQAAPSLTDARHPGNAMYRQAQDAVHRLDARQGRAPDQRSDNLAGSLAVAAKAHGLSRIDHVVLSDDASRAFAVQGDLNSPFKRYAEVNVAQAIATPLAQSGVQWQQAAQQAEAADLTRQRAQQQSPSPQQPQQPAMR